MKQIFSVLILGVCMVVSAADSAMFRFVPDSSIVALEADVSALLKHPLIVSSLKKPEHVQKRLQFEKETGVKYTDLQRVGLYITAEGRVFALLQVAPGFDAEKIFKQNKIAFKKLNVAGRSVLQLEKPLKNGKQVELLPIAPGFLVAGEAGDIALYLKEKLGNAAALRKIVQQIPSGAPLYLAFVNSISKNSDTGLNVQSLYSTLSFTGKQGTDWNFDMRVISESKDAASVLRNTIPFYLAIGLGLVINDPELTADISQCLKCKVNGNVVDAKLYLDSELCSRIGSYLDKNAEKILSRKMGEDTSAAK